MEGMKYSMKRLIRHVILIPDKYQYNKLIHWYILRYSLNKSWNYHIKKLNAQRNPLNIVIYLSTTNSNPPTFGVSEKLHKKSFTNCTKTNDSCTTKIDMWKTQYSKLCNCSTDHENDSTEIVYITDLKQSQWIKSPNIV